MAGSAIFDPPPIPLARPPVSISVYQLQLGDQYRLLPNIRCMRIKLGMGTKPGSAEFRYVFDRGGVIDQSGKWPDQPEEVLGKDAAGPFVVSTDDRLVVFATNASGDSWLIFDGFVQLPSQTLNVDSQAVVFQALATPVRAWDQPLWPTVYREADDPTNVNRYGYPNLDARFNPDGIGNATPSGADATIAGQTYPIFLDAATCKATGIGREWSVDMAARYIILNGNAAETYIKNPFAFVLPLGSRTGVGGSQFWDPDNPATYTSTPIKCRDLDVTGLPWPEALERVIKPHGFGFYFDLGQDNSNPATLPMPAWTLKFYRLDEDPPSMRRSIKLQPYGSALDPGKSNVSKLTLTRDDTDIANRFVVESRLKRYEVCVVLVPLFQPDPADAASADAMKPFQTADGVAPPTAANAKKYRFYGVDEDGSGHWDFNTSAWISGARKGFSFDSIEDGKFITRRRPGKNTLFSLDDAGNPRKATLELSWDYPADRNPPEETPGLFTWYKVQDGWTLLKDRFGIEITIQNPEAWDTGNKAISFGVNKKSSNGKVRGISAQALAGETRFFLRLTAVIDGDFVLEAIAEKRDASPTGFTISRYIDAKQRYSFDTIRYPSAYNTTGGDTLAKDDTKDAKYEAAARQMAHEAPPLAGPVVIPRIVNLYDLGNRISKIDGRNLSLQTNLGNEAGNGPRFPIVIGIEYHLEGRQETILHLSDARGEGRF